MRVLHHHASRKLPMRVYHKNTDPCLSYMNLSACKQIPFMFYTVDADTGYGLQGAVFTLIKHNEVIFESYSNCTGAVWFPPLKEGTYELKELKSPEQYVPEKETYRLLVDFAGNICVDGEPASRFKANYNRQRDNRASFTITKYDIRSGARLEGAVLELIQDDIVLATGISDAEGFVTFSNLTAGVYRLVEKYPPEGYMRVGDSHLVVVANDGTVTIDGHPAEYASIGNKPILYDIFFIKQDEQTGEPLQGATFDLLDGSVVLYTAISDEKGEINFGSFVPGTYTLREQKSPAGYQVNEHEYTVVVSQDGMVTIDGTPVEHVKIKDRKIHNEIITVRKLNKEQKPVGGVILQLLRDESVVASAGTNEKGEAVFINMQAGQYVLVQLNAEGKRIDEFHDITINDKGTIVMDGQVTDVFEWK